MIRSKSSFESNPITICPLSFAFTLISTLHREPLPQVVLDALDVGGLLDRLRGAVAGLCGRRPRFDPLLLHQQFQGVDRVVLQDRLLAQRDLPLGLGHALEHLRVAEA